MARFGSAIPKGRHSERPRIYPNLNLNPNPNPNPSSNPNPIPNPNPSMRVLVGFMGREPLEMVARRNGGPTPMANVGLHVIGFTYLLMRQVLRDARTTVNDVNQ